MYYIYFITLVVVVEFFSGIKIVRPTQRGLIETLGKYPKFALPGFHLVFPVIKNYIRLILQNKWLTLSLR